jgi:alkylation response protein AidB-like acyl-CoA dehydrogenase
VLLQVGDESARAELLPGIADGTSRLAVAAPTTPGTAVEITADAYAGGWSLSGRARQVIDGATATGLLVAARSTSGLGFFAVDPDAAGLSRRSLTTLDPTRKLALIEFREVAARPVSGPDPVAGWTRCLDVARSMLAAEQVGGAERCLRTAVQYAKDRVQFGRPIGSFQAIKHTCANMLITLESARASMVEAVRVVDSPDRQDRDLAAAASLAALVCSDAYFSIASDALHVHGGIGFTWEHSSHLYFRRAKSTQLLLGGADQMRERLLTMAALAETPGVAASAGSAA